MSLEISIYYIIFFLLSVIALLSLTIQVKKYNSLLLVVVSVFLALFAGLRESSPDQGGYQYFFHTVASLADVITGNHNYDENYVEWGYKFLLSVIKFFTDNDIIMFVVIACLSVGGIAYSCRRISPYPLVSVLCYYSWMYYSNLGAIRHALAASLILLMIVALAMNKKIFSVPIYLSAVFVHQVSASAAMLWFVKIITKWRFVIIFLLLGAIVIALKGGIALTSVSLFFQFFDANLQHKLLFYIQDPRFGAEDTFARGVVLKQLLICLFCLFYIRTLNKKFSAFPIVFGAYICSLLILLLFLDIRIINNRISNTFAISEIILIPMILSLFSGRKKVFAFSVLAFFLLFQVYLLVGNQFYPYQFVLL